MYVRSFSATFYFGLRLKSLTDIVDIIGLFLIMLLSIVQVLTVQGRTEKQYIEIGDWFKPKKWSTLVSPYCKVLLLFYFAIASFYGTLEANTIVALTGIQHQFKQVRMYVYSVALLFAIFFLFWRYNPVDITYSSQDNTK